MEQKIDIAIIGECLIELSANGTLADTSTLNKYFGGDTVTTAVAIARLGGHVSYITKVGNDGFSEFILSFSEVKVCSFQPVFTSSAKPDKGAINLSLKSPREK